LTTFTLLRASLSPALTPSTRSIPISEPGIPAITASVPPSFICSAMYFPASLAPSKFSVPT
jgi:hypothetical protein